MKSCDVEISFEIYPPKEENYDLKIKNLFKNIEVLKEYNPSFISVTYGAGGSNREKSLSIVKQIKENYNLNCMPHFTCVCSSKKYIEDYLKEIEKLNITDILALRGDEPNDIDVCYLDFKYAYELVDFISKNTNLNITVACYPEKHKLAKTFDDDILNLKKKVDCGAKRAITQLFFDNDVFYNFLDLCLKNDINIPIIPGILPILNYKQLNYMAQMTNTKIPNDLLLKLEKYKDDEKAIFELGVNHAIKQTRDLIKSGVSGIHFYTLNKSHAVKMILDEVL